MKILICIFFVFAGNTFLYSQKVLKNNISLSYNSYTFFDNSPFIKSKSIYGSSALPHFNYGLSYQRMLKDGKNKIGFSCNIYDNDYYKLPQYQQAGDLIKRYFMDFSIDFSHRLGIYKSIYFIPSFGLVTRLNHEYIHVNYYRWEWNILSHDYINVGAQVGLDFQYKLYKYICIDARLKAMKFLYIAEQYPENHHPMEKKTSTNNILYSIGISYSF